MLCGATELSRHATVGVDIVLIVVIWDVGDGGTLPATLDVPLPSKAVVIGIAA